MTETPTTLVEELRKAAAACKLAAEFYRDLGKPYAAWQMDQNAGRLRARAKRIRELFDLVHAQKFNGSRRELARAICGPATAGEGRR